MVVEIWHDEGQYWQKLTQDKTINNQNNMIFDVQAMQPGKLPNGDWAVLASDKDTDLLPIICPKIGNFRQKFPTDYHWMNIEFYSGIIFDGTMKSDNTPI